MLLTAVVDGSFTHPLRDVYDAFAAGNWRPLQSVVAPDSAWILIFVVTDFQAARCCTVPFKRNSVHALSADISNTDPANSSTMTSYFAGP